MKYKYDIVVVGWTGLKASIDRLLDTEKEKAFAAKYPKHFIEKIKRRQSDLLSVDTVKKGLEVCNPIYVGEQTNYSQEDIASFGTIVYSMDSGGLYRALWDISVAINKGFEINRYSIPVLQETVEVCDFFNDNLYEEDANGSFLIYTQDSASIIKLLEDAGIPAKLIGFATKELAKQIIRDDDIQCLDKPRKSLNEKI